MTEEELAEAAEISEKTIQRLRNDEPDNVTLETVVQLIIGKELLIFNKLDKNIIKILIATLIMCAIIIPIKIFVNLSLVYSLLLCAVVGVIVYFLAIILLKEKYFQLFLKEIKHKFKKEK